jgi:hypothetical protein
MLTPALPRLRCSQVKVEPDMEILFAPSLRPALARRAYQVTSTRFEINGTSVVVRGSGLGDTPDEARCCRHGCEPHPGYVLEPEKTNCRILIY